VSLKLFSTDELPSGWLNVELNEVCSKITDGTHKTPKYISDGIRFISIKNIKPFRPINWDAYEKYISKEEHQSLIQRCKPEYDDILFPRIGTLGYAKRIDFEDEISIFVGLGLAKPDKDIIHPKFLEYWMNHPLIHQLSHDKANGSGRLTLPLEESRKLPVYLPPKSEQIRIVEKLEELLSDLDAGVNELKAAQKKLGGYRQSLLKAAMEGELTADWRKRNKVKETGTQLLQRILKERRIRWETKQLTKYKEQGKTPPTGWKEKYPEPVKPDTTDLPKLPQGWSWATLSQIGWLDRGRSKHRPRNAPHLYGGPYPFVQTGDIRHADTFIATVESSYSVAGLAQSRLWPIGTICITIAANIGKTAILAVEACFPDSVVGFLPATDEVSSRFVEYFLRTAQQKLEDEAPATAQKNINLEILEKVCIPLPPINEQQHIVEVVGGAFFSASNQENAIEIGLRQSAAQRKNILKAAFSGQLVPQDPNDEPASIFLERIRTERTMKVAPAKKLATQKTITKKAKSA
jgi:type I restriction enzyme, S subunit